MKKMIIIHGGDNVDEDGDNDAYTYDNNDIATGDVCWYLGV